MNIHTIRLARMRYFVLVTTLLLSGCDSGLKLAPAGGAVTYKGKPVADANVVFIPVSGVPAFGITDTHGEFKWNTQGEPGAMVGQGTVAITATEKYEFKNEAELSSKDLQKMGRSLIPKKYGIGATSGLSATIDSKKENRFQFDLVD